MGFSEKKAPHSLNFKTRFEEIPSTTPRTTTLQNCEDIYYYLLMILLLIKSTKIKPIFHADLLFKNPPLADCVQRRKKINITKLWTFVHVGRKCNHYNSL